MSTSRSRATSRSKQPRVASQKNKRKVTETSNTRWNLDTKGRIHSFDMKILRREILQRLETKQFYTLGECRVFILELTRLATTWQEEEILYLIYLTDLHEKLFPGTALSFQWPLIHTDPIPLGELPINEGSLIMIGKFIEEMNRCVARMIDRLWESRRGRLLFAARLLQDIEPYLGETKE